MSYAHINPSDGDGKGPPEQGRHEMLIAMLIGLFGPALTTWWHGRDAAAPKV